MTELNPEYFTCVINRNLQVIKLNWERINTTKMPNRIPISKLTFFTLRVKNLLAAYSRGDSIEELRIQFSTVLSFLPEAWNKKAVKYYVGRQQEETQQYKLNPHIFMLWALSFAVLLEVPDEEFEVLVHFIDRDEVKDFVFEFLIASRFPDRPPIEKESYRELFFNSEMFKKLKDIIWEPEAEKGGTMVKVFLEKHWLKTYMEFGLDKTCEDIEQYYYYGKWALEVAAVVKIKNLDDTTFRNNTYYPARLVRNQK